MLYAYTNACYNVIYVTSFISTNADKPNCTQGFLKRDSLFKFLWFTQDSFGSRQEIKTFNGSKSAVRYIIPTMSFNTTGVIKKWIFAARYNYSATNSIKFQVWRSRGNDTRSLTYEKIHQSKALPKPTGYLNVYEIVEPRNITIKAGDVFGLSIPAGPVQYSLAFYARGHILKELNHLNTSTPVRMHNCPANIIQTQIAPHVSVCRILPLVIAKLVCEL